MTFVAIAISVAELNGLHLRQKLATMFVKCKEYECYVCPCLTTPLATRCDKERHDFLGVAISFHTSRGDVLALQACIAFEF